MDFDLEYTLVASTNSGRFALDSAEHGPDLTSGNPIEVFLGGHWIPGRVEFGGVSTISAQTLAEAQRAPRWYNGYYFIAEPDQGVCALMVGMKVRLR